MIERDDELGAALRELPVPPISEEFWDQLRTRCLRAEEEAPAAEALVPEPRARRIPVIFRPDLVFGAGWLVFGLGQLTTWASWLPLWVGPLAAGAGLLIGAIGLLAGAVKGICRGRLPLGVGAATLGAGRLVLAGNALGTNDVVVTEVGRLVLGAGAVALGVGLVSVSMQWLRSRRDLGDSLAEATSVVGKLAGGVSLASFGAALLTRGVGLAAYEAAWLGTWAGWPHAWSSRQLDQFFSQGLVPFAWAGATAAVLGLMAFALSMTAGRQGPAAARPAREVGGLVLALSWLGIEVKALLHGDWLPFGAGSVGVEGQRTFATQTVNPVALVAGLGAVGIGIVWFVLARRRTSPRAPRQLSLQTVGVMLALPAVIAATPPGKTFPAGSYMAELAARGTIRIGVKYDIPSFGWMRPGAQQPDGFDVAMGQMVADRLGLKPQFVRVDSDNRIPMLEHGQVDLVVATMTINDERARQIDFSYPYLLAHQRLLVRKGSQIGSVADLDARHGIVCGVAGSSPAKTIKDFAPHARVVTAHDHSECVEKLEQGKADAVTTDDVILEAMRQRNPTLLEVVGEPLTLEPYGMGVQKGHPEFVDLVNEVIREAKADGRWRGAYDQWVRPVIGDTHTPTPDGQRFTILYHPPSQAAAPGVPAHG
jgi:glutamate transport system substrate-binding protein